MDMVISFNNTGKVEAMHNDSFNLSFLGTRNIRRASDIRFNPALNVWDIYMNDGTGEFTIGSPNISGFEDYEAARKFEVKWLNECRLRGVNSTSWYGLNVVSFHLRMQGRLLTASCA